MISGRYELKYLLNYDDYFNVKCKILPFVRKDFYTRNSNRHKYFIKSLYFDNYNYLILNDKLEGEKNRIKLRFRCYNDIKSMNKFIRVEIKKRYGEIIKKDSTNIDLYTYENFMQNKLFSDNDNLILKQFNIYINKYSLNPCINIEYFREVFESKIDKNLRLSFDHNTKSSKSKDLFPQSVPIKFANTDLIVMEIKINKQIPLWLNKIINENSLNNVTHSKYANGTLKNNILSSGSLNFLNNLNI